MPEIQRIQDQLKRALRGEAWHGPSLLELLSDVNADRATARPLPAAHTIWELVLHVTAWVETVRKRVEGEATELSPDQDWPAAPSPTAAEWNAAVGRLVESHAKLQQVISRLDDSRLDDRVPGKEYSVYFMLHGLIQHDLYHAGQIAILKKAA